MENNFKKMFYDYYSRYDESTTFQRKLIDEKYNENNYRIKICGTVYDVEDGSLTLRTSLTSWEYYNNDKCKVFISFYFHCSILSTNKPILDLKSVNRNDKFEVEAEISVLSFSRNLSSFSLYSDYTISYGFSIYCNVKSIKSITSIWLNEEFLNISKYSD